MYKTLSLPSVLLVVVLPVQAVDCGSPAVDQADDINFSDHIVECDKEPVILYDLKSRDSFLKKKKRVVKAYEAGSTDLAPVLEEQRVTPTDGIGGAAHHIGTTFHIREHFDIDGEHGPVAAVTVIAALTSQMAEYCVRGWEKNREWVESFEQGYYMYYEFTCLGVD